MIDENLNQLICGDQWPELIDKSVLENSIVLTLNIKDSIVWFDGHFPEQAVLPGVVQLHWAVQIVRLHFSQLSITKSQFQQASNVKFKSMILPNQLVKLSLSYNEEKNKVNFSYFLEADELSSGVLVFSSL